MKLIRSALLGLFCCLSLPAFAAGTIFGLPLSQQFLENGEPMSGGRLYLYAGGTSTPSTAYGDFGLTAGEELSHPIELDSSGRIPEFWLADGSYRVRLTDADGNEIFDINSTTALGASSGSGGGGGGSVDEEAVFQTGDIMFQPVDGTRAGWVRANARTIGSSSSGATERANADTEALFLHLWNTYNDTFCPVSGGRGGSAAADWSANKTIGTLNMRGRTVYGMDTMGNTAAGVLPAAVTAGDFIGNEVSTIAQVNLPNVTFSDTLSIQHTHTGPSHTHTADGTLAVASHAHGAGSYTIAGSGSGTCTNCAGTTTVDSPGGATVATHTSNSTVNVTVTGTVDGGASGTSAPDVTGNTSASGTGDTGAASAGVAGSVTSGGSGTAFDTYAPGRVGTWYLKI
jgi:hypothetical protein